jgi:hypothetical protein
MHTAATTSHAALTCSPRVKATTANETAPKAMTIAHQSFVCMIVTFSVKLVI